MTADDIRCSDASETRAEPLYGTASFVRRWVLLEQPGSWGSDALMESKIPQEVAVALKQRAWEAGVRLILIRRGVRFTSEGRVCYFVRTDETDPYLGRMTIDEPQDLLDIDLSSLAEGGEVPGASMHPDPLFLVCTHGRHDACCSIRGNQVSRVACAEPGFDAWESSHIGGDRFAANLVCFPHGVYYGRVAPETVVDLMNDYTSGAVSLEHYRGRSCFTMAVQAAEYFVRREAGVLGIEDLRFVQSVRVDERLLDVTFSLDDGRYVDVRVAIDQSPESFKLTCGATRLNPIPRYEADSITIR